MAAYTVLAIRYRPRVFEDVVGQEQTSQVLRSALGSGRAGHAFLFSGPRGVGKTSMARILAKAFNCLAQEGADPCGQCSVCRTIDGAGDCLDVVEIDGASHNKVENVRDLIENLRFRPVEARYRITIVDEVHMLSTAAFNALLKTLEEPPAHAKFILATTEPLKVPETIRSRCQMYDFRRLTTASIRDRLATICTREGVEAAPELLERLARHAQGGLRDALSLLDQLITYGDGKPTLEDFERLTGRLPPELLNGLLAAALQGRAADVHAAAEEASQRGARAADLVGQLTELLEGLLVVAAGGTPADRTDAERAALGQLAVGVDLDRVLAMLDVLVEAAQRLRQRHDGRLVVEMALLTLARLSALQPVADLLAGGGSTAPVPAGQGSAESVPAARGRPSAPPATPPAPTPARRRAVPRDPDRQVRSTQPPVAGAPSAQPPPPGGRPPAASSGEPSVGQASADPVGATPAPDFRSRFLAAVDSRSLRLELVRYRAIELLGDEVRLVPPADGPAGLYDPANPEVAARLAQAATRAAGRPARIVLDPGPEGAAPGARGAPRPGARNGGPADPSPIERRIQEEWPGAEKVDI